MMLSPVEKLRKFLALEQKRNYDNRAVTGGLEKFLPIWQKESATAGVSPEINASVTAFLTSYMEKDTEARQNAVSEILTLLPPPEPKPARDNFRQRRSENQKPETKDQENPERANRRERPVPTRREERIERKHRPEPIIIPEETHIPEPDEKTEAAPSPAAEAEVQAPVRISHPRQEKNTAPDVAELRKNFGSPQINPKGPSVDSPVSEIPGIGYSNSKALIIFPADMMIINPSSRSTALSRMKS